MTENITLAQVSVWVLCIAVYICMCVGEFRLRWSCEKKEEKEIHFCWIPLHIQWKPITRRKRKIKPNINTKIRFYLYKIRAVCRSKHLSPSSYCRAFNSSVFFLAFCFHLLLPATNTNTYDRQQQSKIEWTSENAFDIKTNVWIRTFRSPYHGQMCCFPCWLVSSRIYFVFGCVV